MDLWGGTATAPRILRAGRMVTVVASCFVLPLTPEVTGIDTSGLYYQLSQGTLRMGPARGVSNVLTGSEAKGGVGNGTLLLNKYVAAEMP